MNNSLAINFEHIVKVLYKVSVPKLTMVFFFPTYLLTTHKQAISR
jgi:hypothetical protein